MTPDELEALAKRFGEMLEWAPERTGGGYEVSAEDLRAAIQSVEREAARLRAERAKSEDAWILRKAVEEAGADVSAGSAEQAPKPEGSRAPPAFLSQVTAALMALGLPAVQDDGETPYDGGEAPRLVLAALLEQARSFDLTGLSQEQSAAGERLYHFAEDACAAGMAIAQACQFVRDGFSSVEMDRMMAEERAGGRGYGHKEGNRPMTRDEIILDTLTQEAQIAVSSLAVGDTVTVTSKLQLLVKELGDMKSRVAAGQHWSGGPDPGEARGIQRAIDLLERGVPEQAKRENGLGFPGITLWYIDELKKLLT